MATKPTKIILASVPEVSVAGENTTVECKVEGGSPKPSLDITASPTIDGVTTDDSATNENQTSIKWNFQPTVVSKYKHPTIVPAHYHMNCRVILRAYLGLSFSVKANLN